jgi:hypothetical protein
MDYVKLYLATSLGFVVVGFLLYRRGNKVAGGIMMGLIALMWAYNFVNAKIESKTV